MLSQTKQLVYRKAYRFIAFILAIVLMLACAACSNGDSGDSGNSGGTDIPASTNSGDTARNTPDTPATDGYWLSDLLTDEEIAYNESATPIEDFEMLGNGFTDELTDRAYDIVFYNEKHLAAYALGRYSGESAEVTIPSYCFGDSAGYGFGYTDEELNYHSYENDSKLEGDFQRITGIYSFSGNTNITSITLPNSITSIGEEAFKDCVNLENITVPDSLLFVGQNSFDNTAWYNNQPDGLVYLGNGLLDCKGDYTASELNLSAGTSFIADIALRSNESIATITLPESCLVIGDDAFKKCIALENVELGGVRYIGQSAFANCTALETIVIPDSCRYISNGAFAGCSALTAAYIPESVAYIGKTTNPFKGCDSVILYVHEGSTAHKYATENGISFELVDDMPDWAK